MITERLWGYDARILIAEQNADPRWADESSRRRFLLRPDIDFALSVDSNVWPTVFDYNPRLAAIMGSVGESLIDVDNDCGGGLWLNLDRMKERLKRDSKPAIIISVAIVLHDSLLIDDVDSPLRWADPIPKELSPGNTLLGYDVANAGLLSGLLNCGYSDEELEHLVPLWRSRINRVGLIEQLRDALEFRLLTETRTGVHGPFFVFGLYSEVAPLNSVQESASGAYQQSAKATFRQAVGYPTHGAALATVRDAAESK